MKKQVFFIAAIVTGVGGAAVTHANFHKTTAAGTQLNWFDPSGTNFDQLSDKAAEEANTGCMDQSTVECARGYTSDQLNDPDDPSAGVQPSQINTPSDVIHKS